MDLNTNQQGNLIVFVIFFIASIMIGFLHSISWSDSYILSVIPGFVGVILGGVIHLLLVKYSESDIELGGAVGFGASLAILVPIVVFSGIGVIGTLAVTEIVDRSAVGNGAYAGTFLISGFSGLVGFNFNQLEESE
mgnify:CR=1 FL=1|jgi:hypothetical protein